MPFWVELTGLALLVLLPGVGFMVRQVIENTKAIAVQQARYEAAVQDLQEIKLILKDLQKRMSK